MKQPEQLIHQREKVELSFSLHTKNEYKKPKTSLCMIVKDEERYLDNCLKSVKEIADEIIIVDTGSKDKTLEIAKQYTNKIYIHPWQESFSEARNHYLKYATGEWIFQIDADEELVQDDIPVLLSALQNEELDAIMVQIISRFRKGKSEAVHNVERIFRNNGIIHYEGRVHNRLVGITNANVYRIRLIHYGYDLNQPQSKKKFDRTVSLLKMDLEDNPYNPMTYHYLSCSYLGQGMFQQSLDAGLKAINIANAQENQNMIYLWSHYNAAMSYYRLKELHEAEKVSISALKKYPQHIDSHFVLILVYFDQQKWHRVIEHSSEYIRLIHLLRTTPEVFDNLVTCSVNEEWNIYALIGIAYFELNQIEKSHNAFQISVSQAPEPFIALRAAGLYFYEKRCFDEALKYLEMAHDKNSKDTTVHNLIVEIKKHREDKEKKPTISCCMIVKNEESFLEQCLESIKDYVDEIIIVDTGSMDRTVEIASRYTHKVYFHPWENSFSKARNQALSYATSNWVFQIDADEELVEGSGTKLREAVNSAGSADAILVNIISTYSNENKTARHNFERLFRNNGIIHYEGIVHNRVVGQVSIKGSKIELMHHGYSVDEEKAHEKFKRTTELLKKQIEEKPDDPMPHHYLGTSYLSRGMHEEAAKESLLAIDLAIQQNDNHPLYLWSHHNASIAFFHMGNLEQAHKYSLQAIEKFPNHLDSFYTLTIIAAEKGEWTDVLLYGDKYISLLRFFEENPDQAGFVINSTMKEGASIHILMGHASYSHGNYDRMSHYYEKAYEISDKAWQVWWNIGVFHLDRSHNLDLAHHYLHMALHESPEEQSIWYMLAKLNKESKLFKDEQQCLEKLFELGSKDPVVLNRLTYLCIKEGDLDKALDALEKTKTVSNLDYSALCNLGFIHREKGQIEQAITSYMQAIEKYPDGIEAWINMGEISMNFNQLDDAKAFFEHAIILQKGLIEVLLYLCKIETKQNNILGLLHWCDLLMEELKLNRNITINGMEDVVRILLDIDFSLRNQPKIASFLLNIFSLLPVDYKAILHTHGFLALKNTEPEKGEFIMKRLQELKDITHPSPLTKNRKKAFLAS